MPRGRVALVVPVVVAWCLYATPGGAASVPGLPGQLDPTFAGGKLVSHEVTDGWDWGEGMAVLPDGKVVMVGTVNMNGYFEANDAGVVRFNPSGTLDTTFADGGKLVIDRSGQFDEAAGVVAQPDGKVVVAGTVTLAGSTLRQGFVMRLLAGGGPDPSFQGGTVLLPPETGLRDIVLQPDGRLVVAGSSGPVGSRVLVARFNPDGRADTTFGTDGIASPAGPDAGFGIEALGLQADGRIVATGSKYWSSYADAAVARFTPSGALDETYGSAGIVLTRFSSAARPRGMEVKDVAIDGQGRATLAGNVISFDGMGTAPGAPPSRPLGLRFVENDVAVVRYLPDGSLDPGFSGDGKAFAPIPSHLVDPPPVVPYDGHGMSEMESFARAVAIDPQGRILVAGAVAQPTYMPSILRFTSGGILDPSFGIGGMSTITMPVSQVAIAYFSDLTLLPGGAIVAVGRVRDETQDAFSVARFLPTTGTSAVWTWGWNGLGQLGSGTTADRRQPAAVPGLSDVVAISAGAHHSLALTGDGTVWAWGWNALGQLGDGTTTDRPRPVPLAGVKGVVAISAGTYHSLALRGDGTVWAWGWNPLGQLGDGTTTLRPSPVQVRGLAGMTSVAAGGLHSVAARDDGTVWAWGWNGAGQLGDGTTQDRHEPVEAVYSSPGWKSRVGAGTFHSLSLTTQPEEHGWGWNGLGQVNPWSTNPVWTSPNPLDPIAGMRVAGGGLHSLVLTDRGNVWTSGWNGVGQLGNGGTAAVARWVEVAGLKAREVAAGTYHNLAVASDRTVRGWGWNALGQLGDRTTTDRFRPTPVYGLNRAVAVSAGAGHSMALRVA